MPLPEVTMILSMLQLLTNCNCSLWEETIAWWYWYFLCYSFILTNCNCCSWEATIGWWYWYSLCYSYWPIVTLLCEKRQLVGDSDTCRVTVRDQLSLLFVKRDNWLVIVILFMLQLLTNCHCSFWVETIGWWYWYSLCYSYWTIVTSLCEERHWWVILILSMIQILTNCHFALWEKTIGWWYWYSLCYSYLPTVTALCKKRQLVLDTDTLYVTVTDQ